MKMLIVIVAASLAASAVISISVNVLEDRGYGTPKRLWGSMVDCTLRIMARSVTFGG